MAPIIPRWCLLIMGCCMICGTAFRIDAGPRSTTRSQQHRTIDSALFSSSWLDDVVTTPSRKAAAAMAAAAIMTASLVAPLPAIAETATFDSVIVEFSESSYPLISKLRGPKLQSFGGNIVDVLFTSVKPPEKLGRIMDLGMDVLDSVPPPQLEAFTATIKDAFVDLKTDDCTLVPLPLSRGTIDRVVQVAESTTDAAKRKTFAETWAPTLAALPKTEEAICLPSVEKLDKLALAQADLGRSFGKAESKAFADYTTPVLKSSFSTGKVLPLLTEAKALAPDATVLEKSKFQITTKKLEVASKKEAFRARIEETKQARAAAAPATISI